MNFIKTLRTQRTSYLVIIFTIAMALR